MKLRFGGPTFDNGDDVSISVLALGPPIQIRTIGVQWLHEEEGDDDDHIQSKDEVINARNSSDDDCRTLPRARRRGDPSFRSGD
jgi:hypothetical protein